MLDPVRNFAKVVVSAGYDETVISVDLSSGEGDKLPDPSTDGEFNLVWYNADDYGDPSDDPNVEIVRATARSGDTLNIERAQEGTTAVPHDLGGKTYKMILALTRKTMEDIDTGLAAGGFSSEVPTGAVNDTNVTFAFTAQPKAIVINGQTWRAGSTSGGVTVWTWSSPNATLAFAVGEGGDIYGIM